MSKGLYIHIPFCNNICNYCDFARVGYNDKIVNDYMVVLSKDIDAINNEDIDTIYIGGGTPSCLGYEQLDLMFNSLSKFKNIIELTFEMNPEDVNEDLIKYLVSKDVNRISLGVQSLNNHTLLLMGRRHNKSDVLNKIEVINNNGIDNISIDLIYGCNNETLDDFVNTLEQAITLNIKHISLYSLTIEDNSKWGRINYKQIDNELEGMLYEKGIDILNANNFKQYEIANFAKEGYESKHNIHYWNYDDFIGVGCGASGKQDNYRYYNEFKIKKYLDGNDIQKKEYLSTEDMEFENIMMSFRLLKGLDINCFNNRYNCSFLNKYESILNNMNDYYDINDDYISIKKEYLIILNEILLKFLN